MVRNGNSNLHDSSRNKQDEFYTNLQLIGNICWFTNLDFPKRHEEMTLFRHYTPEAYPKYDNYDAIEVAKTGDIPKDWNGTMGVPITFMAQYNPEQFEIVGNEYSLGIERGRGYVNGKRMYGRIFIRRRK